MEPAFWDVRSSSTKPGPVVKAAAAVVVDVTAAVVADPIVGEGTEETEETGAIEETGATGDPAATDF